MERPSLVLITISMEIPKPWHPPQLFAFILNRNSSSFHFNIVPKLQGVQNLEQPKWGKLDLNKSHSFKFVERIKGSETYYVLPRLKSVFLQRATYMRPTIRNQQHLQRIGHMTSSKADKWFYISKNIFWLWSMSKTAWSMWSSLGDIGWDWWYWKLSLRKAGNQGGGGVSRSLFAKGSKVFVGRRVSVMRIVDMW